jgi:hypothetical protein
MNERVRQFVTLGVTWLGILLPFPSAVSSFRPGGAADTYGLDPLLTPAPYAFIIWTPIYIGLLGLAVYQALPAHRDHPHLRQVRPWLMASAVLNTIWLWAVAEGNIWLPVLTIFALLAAALAMRGALGIGVRYTGVLRWLSYAVSLYAGWLTLAAIVNTSSALLLSGWNDAPVFWAVLMLIVGTAIGLAARTTWRDPVYGGVFVWTLLAIALGQWGYPLVVVVALLLAGVMTLTLVPNLLKVWASA